MFNKRHYSSSASSSCCLFSNRLGYPVFVLQILLFAGLCNSCELLLLLPTCRGVAAAGMLFRQVSSGHAVLNCIHSCCDLQILHIPALYSFSTLLFFFSFLAMGYYLGEEIQIHRVLVRSFSKFHLIMAEIKLETNQLALPSFSSSSFFYICEIKVIFFGIWQRLEYQRILPKIYLHEQLKSSNRRNYGSIYYSVTLISQVSAQCHLSREEDQTSSDRELVSTVKVRIWPAVWGTRTERKSLRICR